ncbi:hypothetical protein L2E82_04902 [Cichorium intybus]|uniref:Uncharacterized protein n=1 Tax=Cichorium intybus TaxID=13427 RepID=A0ACB9H636_CICIN|nr:hypothetical protein L2E82_04902 [Cichorium intybus]
MCMRTRRGEQTSFLLFDSEIERTARQNHIRKRLFNMSSNDVLVEDATHELHSKVTEGQPSVPSVPVNANGASTSAGVSAVSAPMSLPPYIQPVVPPVSQPIPNPCVNPVATVPTWGVPNHDGAPRQCQLPQIPRQRQPPQIPQPRQPQKPQQPIPQQQPQQYHAQLGDLEYEDGDDGWIPDHHYNNNQWNQAIANANIHRNANRDFFRLKLFPFTLKDKAKYWFTSLPANSIRTWEHLKTKFLQEFYPIFYDGVDSTSQAMVNASSGGTIMMQDSETTWRFLEQLSNGSKTSEPPKDRMAVVANMEMENKWKKEFLTEIGIITRKFNQLLTILRKEKGAYVLHGQTICNNCGEVGHYCDECKMTPEEAEDANTQSLLRLGAQLSKLGKNIKQDKGQKMQPKEDQVNEIITLRSGKKVDNKIVAPQHKDDSDVEIIFDEKEELEKKEKNMQGEMKEPEGKWEVGDFYYATNFLVLDTHQVAKEEQPTIILGRPFLATTNAHIDCRTGEMGISFGHQQSKINIFNTNGGTIEEQECYQIDIVDELVQQYTPEVSQTESEEFLESVEEEHEVVEDKIMEEGHGYEECLQVEKLPSEITKLLKPSLQEPLALELNTLPSHLKYAFLGKNDNLPVILSAYLTVEQEKSLLEVLSKYKEAIGKLNAATLKDHFPVPFIDQIVEKLAGQKYYCFLDGYSGYNQIAVHPLKTKQRRHLHVRTLEKVLARCVESNLVLSWEKSHLMIREGIVLGHVVSERGFEVDRANVKVISPLPPPTSVKGVRSFLGHAGVYRRFIKDFTTISKPLCGLQLKDAPFVFNEEYIKAFNILKNILVEAPILKPPDWSKPFEIMCDASDYAASAVLR